MQQIRGLSVQWTSWSCDMCTLSAFLELGIIWNLQYWMSSCHWEISQRFPHSSCKAQQQIWTVTFLGLSPVHSYDPRRIWRGRRKDMVLLWQDGTGVPFAITLHYFPKIYYPLLHKVKLKLSWDKHQHPHTASWATWGQCKCCFSWCRVIACVSFPLGLQPCHLYLERCCLWPPGFTWLLSVQQWQGKCSRHSWRWCPGGGGKPSQVEGKTETLTETL